MNISAKKYIFYVYKVISQVSSQSYNYQSLMCFYLHNIIASWDQEEMYPSVI